MTVEVCEKQLCRPGPLIFYPEADSSVLSWSWARSYSSVIQRLSLFTPVFWNLHYWQHFHFQNCPSVDDKWCGCPKLEPRCLTLTCRPFPSLYCPHTSQLQLRTASSSLDTMRYFTLLFDGSCASLRFYYLIYNNIHTTYLSSSLDYLKMETVLIELYVLLTSCIKSRYIMFSI